MTLEHSLPTDKRDEMSDTGVNPMPIFHSMREEWLVEGEPSPFNYIHKLLNYGYVLGKDYKTRSRIRWSVDGKRLYFDGRGLEIKKWKKFVHELLGMAEEMMSKHLLFQEDGQIPETDLNAIIDNPDKSDAGYYFVLEEGDAFKKGRQRMIERLRGSEKWSDMIDDLGDKFAWIQAEVDNYLRWDEKFRELLCILIILTCGQTGRGTEMTSSSYMNTMDGDRSVLIEDGQMMFLTEYHKSLAMMDEVKVKTTLVILTIDHSQISSTQSESTDGHLS